MCDYIHSRIEISIYMFSNDLCMHKLYRKGWYDISYIESISNKLHVMFIVSIKCLILCVVIIHLEVKFYLNW